MAKFGYNVNTITIQRDLYFKYNKRNSLIEESDETIPKPKIKCELNDFQSILIVSSHSPFLKEEA